MHRICKALKSGAGSRAGMTLTEVLLGLAVFMTGSVSIIGLFVTASVLHAEGANRRTASFIAEELLAEAQSMRFSEVFAKTNLTDNINDTTPSLPVYSANAANDDPAAHFNLYPIRSLFFPLRPGQDYDPRDEGPLLIGSEWIWCGNVNVGTDTLANCIRGICGSVGAPHQGDPVLRLDPVLQPRTWFYVLDDALTATATTVNVYGDPATWPRDTSGTNDGAPLSGYIVVDEEWMHYTDRDNDGFTVDARGVGDSEPTAHKAGTPVTVAREHPFYPGFYYTVQFYPVNAGGSEARLIISVAYRTGKMFRTWFFRGAYAPEHS